MKLEKAIVVRFGRFCEVLYKNGVEYMKKLINILVLILIIGTLLLSVVACEKEEQETPTTIECPMESLYTWLGRSGSNDLKSAYSQGTMSYVYNLSSKQYFLKNARINSFGLLDDNVEVFYADGYNENIREEKTLITTKWLYYTSIVIKDPQMRTVDDYPYARARYYTYYDIFEEVAADDEYCLEKVALTPYYHERLEEFMEKNKTEFIVVPKYIHEYFPELFYAYELFPAVVQRYNLWDISQEVGKVGSVLIKDGLDTDENGGWSEYKVVGYYETEADKLLSTGVAMEGEEYELVMEQLNNPTYYAMYNLAEAVK